MKQQLDRILSSDLSSVEDIVHRRISNIDQLSESLTERTRVFSGFQDMLRKQMQRITINQEKRQKQEQQLTIKQQIIRIPNQSHFQKGEAEKPLIKNTVAETINTQIEDPQSFGHNSIGVLEEVIDDSSNRHNINTDASFWDLSTFRDITKRQTTFHKETNTVQKLIYSSQYLNVLKKLKLELSSLKKFNQKLKQNTIDQLDLIGQDFCQFLSESIAKIVGAVTDIYQNKIARMSQQNSKLTEQLFLIKNSPKKSQPEQCIQKPFNLTMRNLNQLNQSTQKELWRNQSLHSFSNIYSNSKKHSLTNSSIKKDFEQKANSVFYSKPVSPRQSDKKEPVFFPYIEQQTPEENICADLLEQTPVQSIKNEVYLSLDRNYQLYTQIFTPKYNNEQLNSKLSDSKFSNYNQYNGLTSKQKQKKGIQLNQSLNYFSAKENKQNRTPSSRTSFCKATFKNNSVELVNCLWKPVHKQTQSQIQNCSIEPLVPYPLRNALSSRNYNIPQLQKLVIKTAPIEDGYGVFKPNGMEIYRGMWVNGKFHGKGKLTHPEYSYEGSFKNGLCDGNGTLTCYSQDRTQLQVRGNFKQNKLNGQATLRIGLSSIMGEWEDNKFIRQF